MPHTYDSIQVGDTFSWNREISAADVRTFADLTGDDNPLHLDEEYAASTRFGKTVVHGALLLGLVSKVLGRDFPGPGSIAVSLSAKFLRPVPVGSVVRLEVKVAEKVDKYKHVRAKVYGYVENKMCLGGEAVLIPPTGDEAAL